MGHLSLVAGDLEESRRIVDGTAEPWADSQ